MNTKIFLTVCALCVAAMGVAFYKINEIDSKRWQEFTEKNQCKIVERRLPKSGVMVASGSAGMATGVILGDGPIDVWQCADGTRYEKEAK